MFFLRCNLNVKNKIELLKNKDKYFKYTAWINKGFRFNSRLHSENLYTCNPLFIILLINPSNAYYAN